MCKSQMMAQPAIRLIISQFMQKRAVFLDRDGTLMEEVEYCDDPARVRVLPGVREALERLKAAGYLTIVITNQSGIGRGLFTDEQYRAVEAEFIRQIGRKSIDATYYCPDAPGVLSSRRKPEPGMVSEAALEFDIDLRNSFFVGDKAADIECGRRAGTRTILVLTGYGREQQCEPDFVTEDLPAAAQLVLQTDDL